MKWYIIQTRSLYENKVMEEIPKRMLEADLTSKVGEFFSPEETVVTYKDGVKKESKKKMYSNYIFINMEYNDDIWHALKKISGFAGLIGDKSKPQIIKDEEIEAIKQKITTAPARPKVEFKLDQRVLVKNGSFKDFYGTVKGVDYEKNRIKVSVAIFGRETVVDMELPDVEISA